MKPAGTIKTNLPELLKEAGWKQADFALAVGLERQMVSHVCKGRSKIHALRMPKVLAILSERLKRLVEARDIWPE